MLLSIHINTQFTLHSTLLFCNSSVVFYIQTSLHILTTYSIGYLLCSQYYLILTCTQNSYICLNHSVTYTLLLTTQLIPLFQIHLRSFTFERTYCLLISTCQCLQVPSQLANWLLQLQLYVFVQNTFYTYWQYYLGFQSLQNIRRIRACISIYTSAFFVYVELSVRNILLRIVHDMLNVNNNCEARSLLLYCISQCVFITKQSIYFLIKLDNFSLLPKVVLSVFLISLFNCLIVTFYGTCNCSLILI